MASGFIMPLNKLENFIKNTDGRTLYVNPADLNATDSITNEGTSLTEPFRTLQRALIEAARFSYQRGANNDLIEKTTIILYPGEHTIDNRPGYGIRLNGNTPVAVSPSGAEIADPAAFFNLTADSNFDIESEDNVLWHFNSIYGGVIVPRGTSIVGMDLRKTKIRPLYVPNPTDPSVPESAIFRVTGTCYFWQFTIFDGQDGVPVFTSNVDFSDNNRSLPTFSHHKLTAFEYADGVNVAVAQGFQLTDLAIYYSKLSNAYNEASGRDIDEKYPQDPDGFAPQRPEFEIVGAFATDPINISDIISGDGFVADAVVTVTTATDHGLSEETPIKIRGVSVSDYNVSTKVSAVLDDRTFTYILPFVRTNLPARPSTASANVTIETDTVTGASPYIFNVSMRSVWGINGMHADGSKATGFRSMVVAQFTAISLQKDDRAFVKYNDSARTYDAINVSEVVRGAELSSQSSSTNTSNVYHLDPKAIYRPGWGSTHIKMSNDAVLQIVSVFAIGFNQHFGALSGADASITNSNSNFGQFALLSDGFKKDAFDKDDQGFVTQIVTPRTAVNPEVDLEEDIDWVNLDFTAIGSPASGNGKKMYLLGFTNIQAPPPSITEGFRIGAKQGDRLYQETAGGGERNFQIRMSIPDPLSGDGPISKKVYNVTGAPSNSQLNVGTHQLSNGESVRIFSATGDLPENIQQNTLYYANVVTPSSIRLSTSEANALNDVFVDIFGGTDLRIESRVNDKIAGELGHPIQYDGQWFVTAAANNALYSYIINNPGVTIGEEKNSYLKRTSDDRNLNDKIYRLRYVVPRTATNAKPPTPGYVLQYSSQTGVRNDDDFTETTIGEDDYGYDRNTRWIVTCSVNNPTSEVIVLCAVPHQMNVGENVQILNVVSSNNPNGTNTLGYNGNFTVTAIDDARTFRYSLTDTDGFTRNPGTFQNDISVRNSLLPRYQRKDILSNIFIYRVEEIVEFRQGIRDGVYHLYVLNGSNAVSETFTDRNYNQPIEYLYPQQDVDNVDSNPPSTKTYAKSSPLGDVTIDEPQFSLTRETADKLIASLNTGRVVSASAETNNWRVTFDREHNYNGVHAFASLSGGSGYTNGRYYSVRLLSAGNSWKGASADVRVQSGSVTEVTITDPGCAYTAGEVLSIDPSPLGGGSGATITIDANCITLNTDTIVQVTGAGDSSETFYTFIQSVSGTNAVNIARTSSTPEPQPGMFVVPVDSGTRVASSSFDSATGITTLTRSGDIGFGVNRGNSIVLFDSSRENLGKFYVSNVVSTSVIEVYTGTELTNISLVGKCGLEDNDAPTGSTGENIGIRGAVYFDNSTFYTTSNTTGTGSTFAIGAKEGGVTGYVEEKLPLGTYIQVGNEIMRISEDSFGGANSNIVRVIRGALGTNVIDHPEGTKVRVIIPQPIELRRPSILRASGHTFEYLGYGPGNYSTALPQLQVEQLPDNEVYLVQSQELSCGQVVYTGMSDNGDFYIGNTKYSATSGSQVTFDVPVPTIAGQPASTNNVTFDDVNITRRLFVQGGDDNTIQSQFDGPVKFTKSVTLKDTLTVNRDASFGRKLSIASGTNATSLESNAALTVSGGAVISKNLYIGGDLFVDSVSVDGIEVADIKTNEIEPLDIDANVNLFTTLDANQNINIGNANLDTRIIFRNEADVAGTAPTARASVEFKGGVTVEKTLNAAKINAPGINPIGSIIMWGGSTANIPDGYVLCDGRLLSKPISQGGTNDDWVELFNAIGTTHGENTSGTRFKVPDLTSRFVVGAGAAYAPADIGGEDEVELTQAQLASHDHTMELQNTNHSHPAATFTTNNADAPHDHPASSENAGTHQHPVGAGGNGLSGGAGGHAHSIDDKEHSHPVVGFQLDDSDVNLSPRAVIVDDDYKGAPEIAGEGQAAPRFTGITGTNPVGNHQHSVTIQNAGEHNHTITVDEANARHNHEVTVNVPVKEQSHRHTINPTGAGEGHENRPPYYALCYIILAE